MSMTLLFDPKNCRKKWAGKMDHTVQICNLATTQMLDYWI